jgi:hypothetical protein
MRRRRLSFGLLVALAVLPVTARSQTSPFSLNIGHAETDWPVRIVIGSLLEDPGLRDALDSALPLRFHLRVELWRKAILDRLAGSREISIAILQDPLKEGYSIETGRTVLRVATISEAQKALADQLQVDLKVHQRGRHYYLATLEIETLSLSDIDELRRWLRGEVGPAIEGRAKPTRAVDRGIRRLMVRVLGLPTRRFEARTGTFVSGG